MNDKSKTETIHHLSLALLLVLFLVWAAEASAAPFAYITNNSGNTVSIIDTASNTVTATIPVGLSPNGVGVHPTGTRVYVANELSDTVSVINAVTNAVVATIAVGSFPFGVAVDPAGTFVYVSNRDGNSVSVIDTVSNSVASTIGVPSPPAHVAINPAGTRLYVVSEPVNVLFVIDTVANTVLASVPVGRTPRSAAVHPAGTLVYVANGDGDTVSVVNAVTNTVTATIPAVGFQLHDMAISPDGTRLYVTEEVGVPVSGAVVVIDTATNAVIDRVGVGTNPLGVAVNPAGTFAYVANFLDDTVSVIDTGTNTVVLTVPVGDGPLARGDFIMPVGPLTLTVIIDIKPGSFPNSINLSSAGVIPVAILSSDTFDATTEVNPDTLALAGAAVKMVGKSGKFLCHGDEDVNTDGLLDLVCQFETAQFMIEPGDSVAVLEGETTEGTSIRGEDSIRIVPD